MAGAAFDRALHHVLARLRGCHQGKVLRAFLKAQVPALVLERIDREGMDGAVFLPLRALVGNDPQMHHFTGFHGDDRDLLALDLEQVVLIGNHGNQPRWAARHGQRG